MNVNVCPYYPWIVLKFGDFLNKDNMLNASFFLKKYFRFRNWYKYREKRLFRKEKVKKYQISPSSVKL
jgi:hypothetical protein